MAKLHVPNELIEEIILRLPVKSLMRFKCVSQAWHSRIHSPAFAKSYREVKNSNSKKVMIYPLGPEPSIYSFSANCGEEGTIAVEHVPHNFYYNNGKFKIVGSCNGLLLVLTRKPYMLCIWNPSTRQHKQLPISKDIDTGKCVLYGFGCDPSSDNNYKVLQIQREDMVNKVVLYTSGTNSCKRIKDLPYNPRFHYYSLSVLVNAKLHFFETKTKDVRVIVAFDILNEDFNVVPEHEYDGDYRLSMTELNKNLCVVSYKPETCEKRYVWVMKEYGVKESWTNIFCINLETITRNFVWFHIEPLHLYENGEILLCARFRADDDTFLMVYSNSMNIKAKIRKLEGVPSPYYGITYEETLISPNTV